LRNQIFKVHRIWTLILSI